MTDEVTVEIPDEKVMAEIKVFANNPENLKYKYVVAYLMTNGWQWKPMVNYTHATDFLDTELPEMAQYPTVINLVKLWEG